MSGRKNTKSEDVPSPASKIFAQHLSKYAYSNSTSPSKLAISGPPRLPSSTISPIKSRIPVVEISTSPSKRKISQITPVKRGKRSFDYTDEEDDLESRSEQDDLESSDEDYHDVRDREEPSISKKGKGRVKQASSSKSPAKKPRSYAPPEMYEHLRPVNDLLRKDLDILFCGINPGKKSSTMGHHFSHRTNKFWRALHQSGITPRLLDPTEDHLMLEHGYGLTNLVDRPTSEQAELSTLEMRLNVYNLTKKFLIHQPRLVCFVGKKIWDVYESIVKKSAIPAEYTSVNEEKDDLSQSSKSNFVEVKRDISIKEEIKEENGPPTSQNGPFVDVKLEPLDDLDSSPSLSPPPPITNGMAVIPNIKLEVPFNAVKVENATDLRMSNLKDDSTPSSNGRTRKPVIAKSPTKKVKIPLEPFDATKPRKFRIPHLHPDNGSIIGYTYFWVVPNTSGLERTQLPEQVINFSALREFSEKLKSGWEPSSDGWRGIDPKGVEGTVEEMKRVTISKKT